MAEQARRMRDAEQRRKREQDAAEQERLRALRESGLAAIRETMDALRVADVPQGSYYAHCTPGRHPYGKYGWGGNWGHLEWHQVDAATERRGWIIPGPSKRRWMGDDSPDTAPAYALNEAVPALVRLHEAHSSPRTMRGPRLRNSAPLGEVRGRVFAGAQLVGCACELAGEPVLYLTGDDGDGHPRREGLRALLTSYLATALPN